VPRLLGITPYCMRGVKAVDFLEIGMEDPPIFPVLKCGAFLIPILG
jgi:hypothetical protein